MSARDSKDLPAVIRHDPDCDPIALVCDSPHSGTVFPDGFQCAVSRQEMRQGEDNHIQTLWNAAPRVGATLIEATFSRVYIDPNRSLEDIDPALLSEPWPEPLSPGEKTRLGKGLIWTRLDGNTNIYDHPLSVSEVRKRIDHYYKPYHATLSAAIESRYRQFGGLWHLNLHSMPHNAYERMGIQSDRKLADFVLGDHDGKTCSPEFIALIESFLLDKGYSVARNDPYKGVALIAQIGDPSKNRHSLQIEILRPLYMDEHTREPNEGFEALQSNLTQLLGVVRDHIVSRTT